jgi:predicted NBD/HSP70 family sugar kinase
MESTADAQFTQEDIIERVFLWIQSAEDMDRLKAIGIGHPVTIDPDNELGYKIIASVPKPLFADLRKNAYEFIKKWEDPEDVRNYSLCTYN